MSRPRFLGMVLKSAKRVLGLGGKFIIKPKFATAKCHVRDNLERFQRDAAIKVYFAGEDDMRLSDTKLWFMSTWEPPLPPTEINSCLGYFDIALQKLFVKMSTKSNITKFQSGLIDPFCKDDTHITANSDKGLCPVYVETPRYIKDGIVHLTDAKIYEIISEE